jgi:hypothetical protein
MGIPAMGAMGQTIGQTAQQAMAAHGDLPLRSLNRDEALRAGARPRVEGPRRKPSLLRRLLGR